MAWIGVQIINIYILLLVIKELFTHINLILCQENYLKKKVFIKVPKKRGYPDGICTDIDGGVWVAYWNGGCVIRHFSNGKIDKIINLPVKKPTSLCFGGEKLNMLFYYFSKNFQ